MRGLVHIYFGNGKGKTTCAIGLGIRAVGSGYNALMVQFLKSGESSELKTLSKVEGFNIYKSDDVKGFFWQMNDEEKKQLKKATEECYKYAVKSAIKGDVDLLILDEILGTIENGLLTCETLIEFINNKPEKLELVLTGRKAPLKLIEKADYVSEILEIKHPMTNGVQARKGIEY